MDFKEYQQAAARTSGPVEDRSQLRIAVSALGLAGEAGEVVDALKKYVGHGHALDVGKLTAELGDVLWYIADLCTLQGIDLEDVAKSNIEKLRRRYPDGFSAEASKNRRE